MSRQVEEYVTSAVEMFLVDLPDTDFQCGYLAALLAIAKEGLGLSMADSPFAQAEKLCRSYELMDGRVQNPNRRDSNRLGSITLTN